MVKITATVSAMDGGYGGGYRHQAASATSVGADAISNSATLAEFVAVLADMGVVDSLSNTATASRYTSSRTCVYVFMVVVIYD
jgi:hypothetical protein